MTEYEKPVWGFSHTDEFGNETYKTFTTESSTWVEALQRFMDFARGVGYTVSQEAVAINAEIEVGECAWYGNYYLPEVIEDDWEHPEDVPCPPFEGNPEDCAFKSKCNDCSCMECGEDITWEQAVAAWDEIVNSRSNKYKGE